MLGFVSEINKLSACLLEKTMVNAETSVKKLSKIFCGFGVGAINKISQFVKFVGL